MPRGRRSKVIVKIIELLWDVISYDLLLEFRLLVHSRLEGMCSDWAFLISLTSLRDYAWKKFTPTGEKYKKQKKNKQQQNKTKKHSCDKLSIYSLLYECHPQQ